MTRASLLDGDAPWPVPTGTLGRTRCTPARGPGGEPPSEAWTRRHEAGLVASPLVTADGEILLLDADGALSLLTPDGDPRWTYSLDVTPVPDLAIPGLWRREGRPVVSVAYEGGVLLVEPGSALVADVPLEAPARFLALRGDGLVTWSREGFSLRDDRGDVVDEHRFAWRSDDVAHPTLTPEGAIYYLENREYTMSYDSREDQFLEVAEISFEGGAHRETVHAVHGFTTDAVGALCATETGLFWILDGWRLGYLGFPDAGGGPRELETDVFPKGKIPSRILAGCREEVLVQRSEAREPVYRLSPDGSATTWPVTEPVESVVIDEEDDTYVLAGGRLRGLDGDGEERWTRSARGRWLAPMGEGRLLVASAEGELVCLSPPP